MLLFSISELTIYSFFFLVAGVNSQTAPDEPEPSRRFPACDASSYCIPIRRCSSFHDGWNRRGVGITCGHGEGPYRMVCCPRGFGGEGPQEIRQRKRPRTTTPEPLPASGNSEDCGLSQELDWFREQDMDDTDSLEATWPWMAAILYRGPEGDIPGILCAGFLIDKIHVVTAASCFSIEGNKRALTGVRIGNDEYELGEEYKVIDIKLHENYNRSVFYYDIAILTLEREVNISNFVPICLPNDRVAALDLTGWGTTILGWGRENLDGPFSKSLKQLDNVPIVSNRQCNQIYTPYDGPFSKIPRGITEDILCAGQTEDSREACSGDGGAPAMILYRKRWYAVGITSFGFKCGQAGMPGGYTRVSSYVDWIRNNTENVLSADHNDSTSYKMQNS